MTSHALSSHDLILVIFFSELRFFFANNNATVLFTLRSVYSCNEYILREENLQAKVVSNQRKYKLFIQKSLKLCKLLPW